MDDSAAATGAGEEEVEGVEELGLAEETLEAEEASFAIVRVTIVSGFGASNTLPS